jgi:hypothetical protein
MTKQQIKPGRVRLRGIRAWAESSAVQSGIAQAAAKPDRDNRWRRRAPLAPSGKRAMQHRLT